MNTSPNDLLAELDLAFSTRFNKRLLENILGSCAYQSVSLAIAFNEGKPEHIR